MFDPVTLLMPQSPLLGLLGLLGTLVSSSKKLPRLKAISWAHLSQAPQRKRSQKEQSLAFLAVPHGPLWSRASITPPPNEFFVKAAAVPSQLRF